MTEIAGIEIAPSITMTPIDISGYFNLSITSEELERNIKNSLRFPQFQSGGPGGAVVICAAGPSLLTSLPLVKALHSVGIPICAVKGTAAILIDNGVVPTYVVSMDGRQDQARFFTNPHPDIKYLISGQSHPDVFDALTGYNVTVWHGEGKIHLPAGTDFVQGGSTTTLRAISLMWAKGLAIQHLVGFDCCELNGLTHTYEPSKKQKLSEWVMGGAEFRATPQMVSQYQEFLWAFGRNTQLQFYVHGDGMVATALKIVNDPARCKESLDVVSKEMAVIVSDLARDLAAVQI